MLFASGLIVLPHYQALALGPVRLPMAILMVFAVTQNASVGIFSLFVGPMADRWGNRLTLGLLIAGSAVPPAMAVVLALLPRDVAAGAFWAVFIPLGITPLVLRILINYTLEICSVEQHPRYLSTVNLWVAVPFVLSPLVGWLIDFAGFIPVFSATATVMVVGSLMTFTLDEPRHRLAKEQQALIIDGDT
jgi:MFS family permease